MSFLDFAGFCGFLDLDLELLLGSDSPQILAHLFPGDFFKTPGFLQIKSGKKSKKMVHLVCLLATCSFVFCGLRFLCDVFSECLIFVQTVIREEVVKDFIPFTEKFAQRGNTKF